MNLDIWTMWLLLCGLTCPDVTLVAARAAWLSELPPGCCDHYTGCVCGASVRAAHRGHTSAGPDALTRTQPLPKHPMTCPSSLLVPPSLPPSLVFLPANRTMPHPMPPHPGASLPAGGILSASALQASCCDLPSVPPASALLLQAIAWTLCAPLPTHRQPARRPCPSHSGLRGHTSGDASSPPV